MYSKGYTLKLQPKKWSVYLCNLFLSDHHEPKFLNWGDPEKFAHQNVLGAASTKK